MPLSASSNPTPNNDLATATTPMRVLRGIAVSPGIAIGPVLVLDSRGVRLPPRRIDAGAVAAELARLDDGLNAAVSEAAQAEQEARLRLGPQYADILAAHGRMIADPTLRADTQALISRDQIAAEHALIEVLEAHAVRLERLTDSHLAARAADVRDIETRILGQ
jgi:phosphotransferase system enzyme I (PtsI)